MPVYTLRGRDGNLYKLNGPAGLSRDVLAQSLLELAPEAGIAPKRPGLVGSFMEAATTLPRMGAQATAFAANPNDENRQALLKVGESKYQPVGSLSRKNTFGENVEAVKELVGGSLGQAAAPTLSALGAAAVTGPETAGIGALVAAPAAGAATNTAQYTVQDLYRQAQEQQTAIDAGKTPNHVAVGKAFLAAAGSAGLDLAGEQIFAPVVKAFPFAKNLIFGGGKAAKETTEVLTDALEKGTIQKARGNIAKGIGKGVAFEVPQEVAQQALERWQAGLSLDDADAREEYKQAAIGAAVLGPLMGGATGFIETQTHNNKVRAAEAKTAESQLPNAGESGFAIPPEVDEANYKQAFARFKGRGADDEQAHNAAVREVTPRRRDEGDDNTPDAGGPAASIPGNSQDGAGPTVRGGPPVVEQPASPAGAAVGPAVQRAGVDNVGEGPVEPPLAAQAPKYSPAVARMRAQQEALAARITPEPAPIETPIMPVPGKMKERVAALKEVAETAGIPATAPDLVKAARVWTPKAPDPMEALTSVLPVPEPIAPVSVPAPVIPPAEQVKAAQLAKVAPLAPAPQVAPPTPQVAPLAPAPQVAPPVAEGPYAEALNKIADYRTKGVSEDALKPLERMVAGYNRDPQRASITPEEAAAFIDKGVGQYVAAEGAKPTIEEGTPALSGVEEAAQRSREQSRPTTPITELPEGTAAGVAKKPAKEPVYAERTGYEDAGELSEFQYRQSRLLNAAYAARDTKQINDEQLADIRNDIGSVASKTSEAGKVNLLADVAAKLQAAKDDMKAGRVEAAAMEAPATPVADYADRQAADIVAQTGSTRAVLEHFGTKDGSLKEAADWLSSILPGDVPIRFADQAQLTKLVGSDPGERYVREGAHEPASRVTYVDPNHASSRTYIHETVHAITSRHIRNATSIGRQIKDIYNKFKQMGDPTGHYGFRDAEEFNAEFIANPQFRKHLRKMQAGNLFQRMWNAIRRALGNPPHDLLNRILQLTEEAARNPVADAQMGSEELAAPMTTKAKPNEPSTALRKVNASIGNVAADKGDVKENTEEAAQGFGDVVKEHTADFITRAKDEGAGLKEGTVEFLDEFLPTSAILQWAGDALAPLHGTVKLVNEMSVLSNNIRASVNKLAVKIDAFVGKHGLNTIASVMHIARLHKVDFTKHADLNAALKDDYIRKTYADKLNGPNLDPRKKGGFTASYNKRAKEIKEAYALWDQLGKQEGGHELYKEVRHFYRDMYTLIRTQLDENIQLLNISDESKEKLMNFVRLTKEKGKGEYSDENYPEVEDSGAPDEYFPFMRFGNNWLKVDAKLDPKVGKQFYLRGSKAEIIALKREIAKKYGIDPNSPRLEMGFNVEDLRQNLNENSTMLKEMFTEIEKAFASNTALDSTAKDRLKDALYQTYLMTLPERSLRRQFIHSNDVTGFSSDILRVFKRAGTQYASQISKLKYAPRIENSISATTSALEGVPPDEAARLKIHASEIAKRAREQINPTPQGPMASALNRASFLMFLTSGATAATQFTGIPIRVLPRLVRLYGTANAFGATTKWANLLNSIGVQEEQSDGSMKWVPPSAEFSDMVKNNPLFRRAFAAGKDRGAFGSITDSILGDMPTPVGTLEKGTHKTISTVYNMMTGMFNASEKTSREITYMMGFEQEFNKTKDFDKAVEAGTKLVEDTLGNYSNIERPSFATKSDLARMAFLFKMYAVNTTKFFYNNAHTIIADKNASLAEKRGALAELTGVLGMGALFHGMTGMPLYSLVMATLSTLAKGNAGGGDDDDPEKYMATDADYMFRYKFLPKWFGPMAGVVANGAISEASGLNIGSRTSFDSMWFREGQAGKDWAETVQNTILANIAGASLAPNFIGAVQDFNDGNITRGFEKSLPAFFKGAATAYRLGTEGAETRGGDQIMEIGELPNSALIGQGIGFQPTKLADIQHQTYAITKRMKAATDESRKLMQRFNSELVEDNPDHDKLQDLLEKMQQHNERYPFPDSQITPDKLSDSFTAYMDKRRYMMRGLPVPKGAAPYLLPDLARTYEQ